MLEKIISGGQTGVDTAALNAAMALDLDFGGWCPKGRINEDGIIPPIYDQLNEITGEYASEKENYDARTVLNIRDSDATLILVPSIPVPEKIKDGTILTIAEVKKQDKPYLIINLSISDELNLELCLTWLIENNIHILNIAGPRESNWVGIGESAYQLLVSLLHKLVEQIELAPRPI